MLGETGRPVHNTKSDIAITSDGTTLAYTYIGVIRAGFKNKRLDIPNSERDLGNMGGAGGSGLLFFSQDDEWLHFLSSGSLNRVRIEGGSFQVIDPSIKTLRSGFTAFRRKDCLLKCRRWETL